MLVVGAFAVMIYSEPRYTKDLDVWVETSDENARRVFAALKDFGAPLKGPNRKRLYRIRLLSDGPSTEPDRRSDVS